MQLCNPTASQQNMTETSCLKLFLFIAIIIDIDDYPLLMNISPRIFVKLFMVMEETD